MLIYSKHCTTADTAIRRTLQYGGHCNTKDTATWRTHSVDSVDGGDELAHEVGDDAGEVNKRSLLSNRHAAAHCSYQGNLRVEKKWKG